MKSKRERYDKTGFVPLLYYLMSIRLVLHALSQVHGEALPTLWYEYANLTREQGGKLVVIIAPCYSWRV